jgi:ATP-dependent Clp protease ATP-binding subunit ClpB
MTATTYAVHEYNPNAVKLGVHLSKYGVNLSKLAHEGKLEAVVGRDSEIRQTIQILSRRRKNNPCLIGESGVGKTSIAEGLANLIAQGNVPDSMKDKVIVSLDLASMIAGTKFRGEFEDRLKGVLKEIEQANDRIILFIDEMHTIVGAGGSEGAIDASNILKPSLARGNLRCLGTTTNDEYSKYIEKDPALARRFQSVYVPEPTEKDTIDILKGLRPKYESHHRIRIPDDAIEAAVKLSGRYLTAKKFPDKAIDLVDEAASRLRNRIESIPPRLLEVEKDLEMLHQRIEDNLLSNNKEVSVKDTLNLYKLNEEKSRLYQRWRQQNELLSNIFEINREILRLREEVKTIRRSSSPIGGGSSSSGNGGNAALDVDKLHHTLMDIQRNEHRVQNLYAEFDRLDQHHVQSGNSNDNTILSSSSNRTKFRNSLDPKDLAEIISQSTGIPISSMLEDDDAKALLQMEDELQKQIIGQNEAITAIAKCIRLSRAGLRFHDRPMGVFLMLGPTVRVDFSSYPL